MTHWCAPGKHDVTDNEAQIIDSTETGSGPGRPVYACHTHIRERGIVPTAAAFVERREGHPVMAAGSTPTVVRYGDRAS